MALLARVKNWVAETLSSADLNAEIDNILNNLNGSKVEDYSANTTEMQTTTDPGEVSSESLATTLNGELERLRFVLKEIKGDVAQWYTTGATSLSEISAALGTSLDGNRISSGAVRTDSNQPLFLIPNGAAASVLISATATDLIYFVNGTQVTVAADATLSSLNVAPSSNNTALVNDAAVADGEETKILGEYGTEITIDAAGSEITSKVGEMVAFGINNGSADEYFIARVHSATQLKEVRRGFFFNSSSNPVPRLAIADNDTITLLRLNWIFGKSDGTFTKTANEPKWQVDTPSAPSTDDYWFDLTNNTWKRYDGASFLSADATFLGIAVCDATNCIAARSLEFAGQSNPINTIQLESVSATQVRAVQNRATIGVFNSEVQYNYDNPVWDITADLESGVTESSATMYYLYITEDGDEVISDKIPYDREGDLQGYFHPHHVWRCVGQVYNDGSSDLEVPRTFEGVKTIFPSGVRKIVERTDADGAYTISESDDTIYIDLVSADVTLTLPPVDGFEGKEFFIKRTDVGGYVVANTFVDGDVTVGTDNINITGHSFVDLQKLQLTTTGTLPAGLALATDYFVIFVDDDNIKLASSRANAVADTAVDITAAAGGGTHTATSQQTILTIDPDASEQIEEDTTRKLYGLNENAFIIGGKNRWEIISSNQAKCIVRDVKASGTGGGTFTSGSYQTRVLNTLEDYGIGASLSSNQVTLPAGTYELSATGSAYFCGTHKLRWQNITDGRTLILGHTSSANAGSGNVPDTMAQMHGVFTIKESKAFELQHRCSLTQNFGNAASYGDNETYATVRIRKL
jgi:hypothetical protein